MNNLQQHLSRCIASSLARQIAFGELTGHLGWAVDVNTGTITFGDDLRFPIQLLGTESDAEQTWLWAWANTRSNLPPALLRAATWLREYGLQHRIPELTEAQVPLDSADGHLLALLSAGLTGRCYYRGSHQGGAVFLLVEAVPDSVLAPVPPERAVAVLSHAIGMCELDHRTLVGSFLTQQGWQVETAAAAIAGRHPGGSELRVEFDGQGRIGDIRATIQAG
ncbi:hypothetical protein FHS43_001438 [Streptosporangium becharense]|uniref:Uncharacterized protein n=1 Tax=Streptosporangium becharense TaxID=1816182 RepID=A0A7W9ILG8_9ACTN|nr:DUF6882 domain-containing protein [Streptosporangium becharense]MBB2910175.1 hypothetical protein [Streptosporangium becharense]MBB5822918.1 hypothetical protein [Streptosporangium becharense]